MALIIPTIESSPSFDAQAWMDSTDLAALTLALSGTGVVTGCIVSQNDGSSMSCAVAAGTAMINGLTVGVASVSSLTIGNASASDRRDIVVVNSSGSVSVVAGTPCGTASWTRASTGLPPIKPSIPANSALLGEVTVGASTTVITTAANIIDKTTIVGGAPGTLLARTQYAPSSAGSYSMNTSGFVALDPTNLSVTFVAPPSGDVKVRLQAFVKGAAAAAKSTAFAVVSTTASPGTLVGVTGLVDLTPTATAGDNGVICSMDQIITGLSPRTSYTWYFAAMCTATTPPTIIPQGGTANNALPTGAPAVIEVIAA